MKYMFVRDVQLTKCEDIYEVDKIANKIHSLTIDDITYN